MERIVTNKSQAADFLHKSAEAMANLANMPAEEFSKAADMLVECFLAGGKVLIFGNGGSAADAQHFAGELVGRFLLEREGLPAIALTTDTSVITSIANDYSYEVIFSRQVQALGKPGDIAFGISTSGNSANVVKALEVANAKNLRTLSLTGPRPNKCADISHHTIAVESKETPLIQHSHIAIIHLLCGLVEQEIFGQKEKEESK